jgi:hypothetical protein
VVIVDEVELVEALVGAAVVLAVQEALLADLEEEEGINLKHLYFNGINYDFIFLK